MRVKANDPNAKFKVVYYECGDGNYSPKVERIEYFDNRSEADDVADAFNKASKASDDGVFVRAEVESNRRSVYDRS